MRLKACLISNLGALKVRLLTAAAGHRAGDTVRLEVRVARALISSGQAVAVAERHRYNTAAVFGAKRIPAQYRNEKT